jgi:two-component system response regulator
LSNPPKLVLLDLKLPKVDGLQVLREIKAKPETRAIPVIALMSSREESDLLECYRLGVNSYIQKPVDFDKFRETIRAVRIYWATINQPPPQKAFAAQKTSPPIP